MATWRASSSKTAAATTTIPQAASFSSTAATVCLRAQGDGEPFPEPPETTKALTRERARRAALEQVAGEPLGLFPYDKEAFVERGELVPRSLVAGRELGEWLEDLSELPPAFVLDGA